MCFVTMTVWNCIIDSGTQSGLETNYHHQTTSGYLLEMMIAQSREEVLPHKQLILNKVCKTVEASLIKLELITLIRSDILALKTLQPAILECESKIWSELQIFSLDVEAGRLIRQTALMITHNFQLYSSISTLHKINIIEHITEIWIQFFYD